MSLYAERAYACADNPTPDHCAHIATRDDREELARKEEIGRRLHECNREIARFVHISQSLPRREVPQFQRSLDALLSRPKLERQLKEIA